MPHRFPSRHVLPPSSLLHSPRAPPVPSPPPRSGSWSRGIKSGKGTFFVKADESQLVGTWEKGSMVAGKWIWKDGTSWHGPCKDSRPLGKGVFYFPNGTVQEGEYVQEGNAEDPEAELKTVWKGGPVRAANASAAEVIRST